MLYKTEPLRQRIFITLLKIHKSIPYGMHKLYYMRKIRSLLNMKYENYIERTTSYDIANYSQWMKD